MTIPTDPAALSAEVERLRAENEKLRNPLKLDRRSTQDQCCAAFGAVMARLYQDLEAIDNATPAEPYEEPEWWCKMMDIHRAALNHARNYATTHPEGRD